jgi:uncharacterized protein
MVALGLRVASEIRDRLSLVAESVTFGGLRDIYKALGYAKTINLKMYRDRYDRGGLAGRIIEAYPTATWRGIGEMIEDPDPTTETKFEGAWNELQERLDVWAKFRRADIIAGLGRYSVVFIGAPGNTETELPKGLALDDILYLSLYNEGEATIKEYELDPANKRFGLPKVYVIRRNSSEVGKRATAMNVHWSRVIHVSDGLLEDDVFSRPRLERAWNDLDNLMKITGGGSEAFWKTAYPGVQFNIDKDMKFKDEQLDKLKEEIDSFMHEMTRAVKTKGVNMETLQANVANFKDNALTIISIISGITGIPQRMLLGSERGELASTQDRDNWAERVRDRRDSFAGPYVVKVFVNRLIEYGALPKPTKNNGKYTIGWGDVFDVSQTERIENAEKMASVNQKAGETVLLPNEIRDLALGLEPLDEEDLEGRDEDEETEEEDLAEAEEEDEEVKARAAVWQRIASKSRQTPIVHDGRLM